jgi:endonuclease/exonuclease/phosphatase family metal-dependent hydrolase
MGKFSLLNKPYKTFVVMNTHMDHVSDEARGFGASLILAKASMESAVHSVFVMGDLNR